eukprot:6855093-Prymnesium_polylepis.2
MVAATRSRASVRESWKAASEPRVAPTAERAAPSKTPPNTTPDAIASAIDTTSTRKTFATTHAARKATTAQPPSALA